MSSPSLHAEIDALVALLAAGDEDSRRVAATLRGDHSRDAHQHALLAVLAELERLDPVAAVRARRVLSANGPDPSTPHLPVPPSVRLGIVFDLLRAHRAGIGVLNDDHRLYAPLRDDLTELAATARNVGQVRRWIDPHWARSEALVADVVEALLVGFDRGADLSSFHAEARAVLERFGKRSPITQREFLEGLLTERVRQPPRDSEAVLRLAAGLLFRVYEDGPAFGIPRKVPFNTGVARLDELIAKRFERTRGWDDNSGELKPKRLLRDVLVAAGMTDDAAENALRRVGDGSGQK